MTQQEPELVFTPLYQYGKTAPYAGICVGPRMTALVGLRSPEILSYLKVFATEDGFDMPFAPDYRKLVTIYSGDLDVVRILRDFKSTAHVRETGYDPDQITFDDTEGVLAVPSHSTRIVDAARWLSSSRLLRLIWQHRGEINGNGLMCYFVDEFRHNDADAPISVPVMALLYAILATSGPDHVILTGDDIRRQQAAQEAATNAIEDRRRRFNEGQAALRDMQNRIKWGIK